jgi:ribosomal-protein-alanine N-acetyltransferase
VIRKTRVSDLGPLTALVGRDFGGGWDRSALASAHESLSARILIAEGDAGAVVGFVVAWRVVDLLEVDLLGVVPPYRRQGVAVALLEHLIEAERQAGAAEGHLELRASNAAARALYRRLGFVVLGRRARYYPDGEDALLLTRVLSSGLATEE